MQIIIEDLEFFIHINANAESIRLLSSKNDILHLEVPTNYPQKELEFFIKQHFGDFRSKKLQVKTDNIQSIKLFDQDFDLFFRVNCKKPQLKDKAIYYDQLNFKSRLQLERFKNDILQEYINTKLGFWEEIHNTLLYSINLRKLNKSYYNTNKAKQQFVFSKRLLDKSLCFVDYIVASASFDQIDLNETDKDYFLTKYVKDWKQSKKIIDYEFGN